jgi:rare lipoprotein A
MNKRNIVFGLSLLTVVLLCGCVTKRVETREYGNNISKYNTKVERAIKKKFKRVTYGKASWYGKNFDGKKTASGEIFRSNKRTAAHKTLPFNTMVKVTDMVSNRIEIVRINDRRPFSGNRIIDLSFASAKKLGVGQTRSNRCQA